MFAPGGELEQLGSSFQQKVQPADQEHCLALETVKSAADFETAEQVAVEPPEAAAATTRQESGEQFGRYFEVGLVD